MADSASLTYLPATSMGRHVAQLKEILEKKGIEAGLPFEKAERTILEMEEAEAGKRVSQNDVDHREAVRNALSLAWFAEKIVDANKNATEFCSLGPHLQLLTKTSGFAHCSISVPASPSEREIEDKLFELQVALGLFPWAVDVSMDSLDGSSGGKNPDILFSVEKKMWAIACKTIHSKNPLQFRAAVLRAVEQIENSEAPKGFVFINARHIIDHDHFFSFRIDPEAGGLMAPVWKSHDILASELTKHIVDKLQLGNFVDANSEMRDACVKAGVSIAIVGCVVGLANVDGGPKLVLVQQVVRGDMRVPDVDANKIIEIYGKFSNAVMIG